MREDVVREKSDPKIVQQRRFVQVAKVDHVVRCTERCQRGGVRREGWACVGGGPDCRLASSMAMKLPLPASSENWLPSSICTVICEPAPESQRRGTSREQRKREPESWFRTMPLPPSRTFAGDHVSTSWLYHTQLPASNAAIWAVRVSLWRPEQCLAAAGRSHRLGQKKCATLGPGARAGPPPGPAPTSSTWVEVRRRASPAATAQNQRTSRTCLRGALRTCSSGCSALLTTHDMTCLRIFITKRSW